MLWNRKFVSGEGIVSHWGLDPHKLSYLVLKHDLTVLDLPKSPSLKSVFRPSLFKIQPEDLVKIILFDPKKLYEKTFYRSEIGKIDWYLTSYLQKKVKKPDT